MRWRPRRRSWRSERWSSSCDVHRCEAAAGGPEVGRLPLVEPRCHELDPAFVDIATNVRLHQEPLARRRELLRDVVALHDFREDPARELVAAIGAAAAEAALGFEEPLLAIAPPAFVSAFDFTSRGDD